MQKIFQSLSHRLKRFLSELKIDTARVIRLNARYRSAPRRAAPRRTARNSAQRDTSTRSDELFRGI
jgi:hypothetical protein